MRMLKKACIILILPPQKTSKTYIDCINLLKVRIISCYHCFFFCRGFSIFSKGLPKQPAQHVLSGQKLQRLHDAKILYVVYFMSKKLVWGMSPDFFFLPGLPEVLPYTSPMLCMSLDWLKENLHRKRFPSRMGKAEKLLRSRLRRWGAWREMDPEINGCLRHWSKNIEMAIMIYYVSLHYKDKSVSSLRLCQ